MRDASASFDRENGGCPAAFNTAFAEASGDFVALCGADDIWEPRKLEWQLEAIRAHPQVDLLCGHAVLFGRSEGEYSRPPGVGVLDSGALKDALYRQCCICAPSVVIRRSLFERLGPFIENFGADDHEYWFRCLRAGASFYYDPRPLLSWRQHENNLTGRTAWMDECGDQVRRMYEADVSDRAIARRPLQDRQAPGGRRAPARGAQGVSPVAAARSAQRLAGKCQGVRVGCDPWPAQRRARRRRTCGDLTSVARSTRCAAGATRCCHEDPDDQRGDAGLQHRALCRRGVDGDPLPDASSR